MSHEEFFNRYGAFEIHPETTADFEELYQAIKARLMAELVADSDELLRPARLVDASGVQQDGKIP